MNPARNFAASYVPGKLLREERNGVNTYMAAE
jgi:hypothetical protein